MVTKYAARVECTQKYKFLDKRGRPSRMTFTKTGVGTGTGRTLAVAKSWAKARAGEDVERQMEAARARQSADSYSPGPRTCRLTGSKTYRE